MKPTPADAAPDLVERLQRIVGQIPAFGLSAARADIIANGFHNAIDALSKPASAAPGTEADDDKARMEALKDIYATVPSKHGYLLTDRELKNIWDAALAHARKSPAPQELDRPEGAQKRIEELEAEVERLTDAMSWSEAKTEAENVELRAKLAAQSSGAGQKGGQP